MMVMPGPACKVQHETKVANGVLTINERDANLIDLQRLYRVVLKLNTGACFRLPYDSSMYQSFH